MSSAIVFTFAVLNRNNDIICGANNTAFVQRAPICLFQASASVFIFTWIEVWSLILAYDSYRMIAGRHVALHGQYSPLDASTSLQQNDSAFHKEKMDTYVKTSYV